MVTLGEAALCRLGRCGGLLHHGGLQVGSGAGWQRQGPDRSADRPVIRERFPIDGQEGQGVRKPR